MTTIAALVLGALAMQDRPPFPEVKAPDYPRPASREEWTKRREETRKTLERLLGDLPPDRKSVV